MEDKHLLESYSDLLYCFLTSNMHLSHSKRLHIPNISEVKNP